MEVLEELSSSLIKLYEGLAKALARVYDEVLKIKFLKEAPKPKEISRRQLKRIAKALKKKEVSP